MKLYTHIPSTLASAAITMALTMSPAGASAQAPPPKPPAPIVESIMKTTGFALPSIGNGTVAWAVLNAKSYGDGTETSVWTLRDGQPVIAATLARFVAGGLESGTDAAGHPVAIAATRPYERPARAYLVRLDTGAVRRLAFGPRARFVDAVAIDAGRVIYSTSVGRNSERARSSLWTAGLDGRTVTNSKRLRRSRRGVTFNWVRADRDRIAVTGDRGDLGADRPLYAGTAHGAWRKVATGWSYREADYLIEAAGFSRSRRSVLVTASRDGSGASGFSLERVSLVTGRTKKLFDHWGGYDMQFAYDPDSGRLLVAGDFGDVGSQIGWTKPFR